MSALINATLRLGVVLGAAFALYREERHTGSHAVSCHHLTSSACFQLVARRSLLEPTSHLLVGALAGLLLAALLTLPLRLVRWGSRT